MIKHRGYSKGLAKFFVRYGRGNGHLNFIINIFKLVVYYGGFAYLMQDWFNIELPKEVGIIGAFGFIIAAYVVGWVDEKVGFWKQEADYGVREINPFFKEMNEKIDRIEQQVNMPLVVMDEKKENTT